MPVIPPWKEIHLLRDLERPWCLLRWPTVCCGAGKMANPFHPFHPRTTTNLVASAPLACKANATSPCGWLAAGYENAAINMRLQRSGKSQGHGDWMRLGHAVRAKRNLKGHPSFLPSGQSKPVTSRGQWSTRGVCTMIKKLVFRDGPADCGPRLIGCATGVRWRARSVSDR